MSPAGGPDDGEEARAFFTWVHELVAAGDPRLRALGAVETAYATAAAAVAQRVRHSVWHMTLVPSWTQVGVARPFAELRHRPAMDLRYLTSGRALTRLPLLASHHHPYLRVGHVVDSMLVVDGARIFVGEPHSVTPVTSVWESTDGRVVAAAVRVFDAAWRSAEPAIAPGEDPPFTRRMVQVAFHLTAGASDREIARALGVSVRTVSAEVAEIVRRLGARSRTHAIGLITGAAY
ncbi:helix-turn-helix transcriptional regulator [Oryzobacter sp. R7]|uniref:helix-turn-helix transcriptional regulator n=1 Tax=Oryzobacter faecalis TaxID=3388656 RepID=UPI00398CDE48